MQEFLESLGETLKTAPPYVAYLIMLAAGVVTSFTPCVYPIIPLTVGFIGAQTRAASGRAARFQGFFLSLLFTLGMAITYAVAGALAAATGRLFGSATQSPWAYLLVGIVFLLMGMSLLDVFQIQTPRSLQKLQTADSRSRFLKPILIGMVSAIVIGPCTGPVVLVFLTYIWQKSSVLYGASMLFVFGLGLGALVILAGTFAGFLASLPKSGQWTEKIKRGFGWVMVAAAVFIVFRAGQMSYGGNVPVAPDQARRLGVAPPMRDPDCPPPAVPIQRIATQDAAGKLAPEIALPTPSGGTVKLSAQRGKVVLVAFWAAGCTACIEEVPKLNDLQAKYAAHCFTVLGVNAFDNAAKTAAVVRQKGMTYPVVLAAAENVQPPDYNVVSVPVLVLVDRWGVITWRGTSLTQSFHVALDQALAADPKRPRPQ